MVDISKLSDQELVQAIESRMQESASLSKTIEKATQKNKPLWLNEPEWLSRVSNKRSKARDNRTFLAVESVINTLTGRPSRPNTIPANDTDDARIIADDLQDFFLAKYRDLGMKKKMRRGLRNLFLSRFMVFKVVWDPTKDDFDIVVKDPKNIRVSKHATSMYDTEFAIEEIPEISLSRLLELFPDKKKDILEKQGMDEQRALIDNPQVSYKEVWIDGYVCWEFQDQILGRDKHPYWDWDGIALTDDEYRSFVKGKGEGDDVVHGRRRRARGSRLAKESETRRKDKEANYQSYLYNHFDRPIPPYIFGTALEIENGPVGETSLIEQVAPLQYEIDKRKRQISDNADLVNGRWKVDTDLVTMNKGAAQSITNSTGGVIYGSGVRFGVELMNASPLPNFVFNEMNHSIEELDNIFGTQPTFRGDGSNQETATGRAILREQSFARLDELIDLVDGIHHQIYSWWYQMMRVRYTEEHLVKPIGAVSASQVISLTRDDLQEGIEINVVPGQIVPEDRLFKAERAKEEAAAGIIDPLTYFEETGRDNPMKLAKRLVLYQMNPLSILELDDEDQKALIEAQQFMSLQQTGQVATEGMDGADPRAQQLAEFNRQVQELTTSPEFQEKSQEEKQAAYQQIKQQYQQLEAAAQSNQ